MGHSQNLAASTYQVSMATGQIKNTMAVMAEGTSSQTAQINQTQSTLNELLDNIDRINRQAEAGAAATEQTARAVADGAAALEQTLSAMKGIEQSVGGTWQTVEALATHSRQIDEVAELIQDIASRVNVLALNAQIEATRAGEAGRGFKIVANEIRTLSKNTGAASRKVMDLIALVQTDADKVGKAMHDGLAKIQESERLTHGTGESLNRIRSAFEGDKARLQEIATEIKGMQKFSHQVGTAMGNVSRISEKNMQAAEEVNASTEEMTAQLEDVADLAQSLETMAKGEQQLLAKFRV
jgi:methyl-accepting chemotaxis protein